MDGSGRVSKHNRQFLKPILPFVSQDNVKLPNQTFDTQIIHTSPAHDDYNTNESIINNTVPSSDSREATTPRQNKQLPTDAPAVSTPVRKSKVQAPQPTSKPVLEPDTLPQSRPMSDADFNAGLSQSIQNIRNISPQNKGTAQDNDNTRSKRVKFCTKRYIQQY